MLPERELTDRRDEEQIVKDALDQAQAGGHQHARFLEFYGLAGIGKTKLLNHNRRQARELNIPSARIDLGNLGSPSETAQSRLIEQTINQLDAFPEIPRGVETTRQAIDQALDQSAVFPDDPSLNSHYNGVRGAEQTAVTNAFVDYLRTWLDHEPILLIFDDTDSSPEGVLLWLNRQVLAQLADCHRLVVIFAGQTQLRQADRDRKTLPDSYPLAPFNFNHTEEQMLSKSKEYPQIQSSARWVYSLTCGHPYSINFAMQYLQIKKLTGLVKPEQSELEELANRLRREVIQKYIFQQIPETLRPVLQLIAYPRRFDSNLLAHLLYRYGPEVNYEPGNKEMVELLARLLTNTSVVTYEPGVGGYKLDDLLAQLIQTCDLSTNPERFSSIHSCLADWQQALPIATIEVDETRRVGDGMYHAAQHYRARLIRKEISLAEAQQQVKRYLWVELVKWDSNLDVPVAYANTLQNCIESDDEIEAGLPGLRVELQTLLRRFIQHNSQQPCAMLGLMRSHQAELSVNLQLPGNPIIFNTHPAPFESIPALEMLEALESLTPPPSLGRKMFLMNLSRDMQIHLSGLRAPLRIMTTEIDQPWELMHDGQNFLCLQIPIGRQPVLPPQAIPRRNKHLPGERPRFLLVVDPNNNLPDARAEAIVIQAQLKDRYGADVVLLAGETASASAFEDCLMQGPAFDVIHYAGHARFNKDRPSESYLQLHDRVVYAYIIERMLNGRPLVFLNACTAGYEQPGEARGSYMSEYTTGLVTSFILGGARACIGPLWRVPDGAAKNFALAFYDRALQGDSLGEAMLQARKQSFNDMVRRERPERIWAAYVLYGDPTRRMFPNF